AELDRFMIALHRAQTKGRVAYRRLCGMHRGGGGTRSPDFMALLHKKMDLDVKAHYGSQYPDNYYWPEPVPNAPFPTQHKSPSPFTYTFCWHAEPQFIVWHRPLMLEFERMLQDHDP
ncbi:hypothetical protein B484DRAFT_302973, partial [Ochromonadaceae sp. CCMP2298]